MKNFFLNPIIVISLIIATTFSCASNDDISIPDLDKDNPTDVEANTELLAITDLFTGNVIEFDQVQNGGELVTSGFIISSDVSSNINNQIYIQDKTEDATSGLVIDVELDNIFLTHGIGREVLIKLNGLGMKKVGNELHIGVYNDGAITPISGDDFQDFVIRTNTKETIVPKILTINEIIEAANSDEPLPTILVSIENVQIIDEQLNTTYANVDNNSDVDKTLINCTDEDTQTIILQNSGLSTFKALPFPTEQGTITAILSKNKLIIRDTNDIDFTEERCIDDSVLLHEDFESITETNEIITLDGWVDINISDPQLFTLWVAKKTGDNIFAEIEQGGSSDKYDAWLITKEIQIQNSRTLKFNLNINVNSRNSDNLEIFIVDSVNGDDINFSEDNEINNIVPTEDTNGFIAKEATITIPDNLDSFRIGFRYNKRSSIPSNTEYQIDNIVISEE
ncbi:DUF5689 domain-containing protein [Algibacter lectus]|uniref:DUF5689 domain-containing protein n=2 Tax=Algibacter lectus TaxID=221126 RepID=A0A090VJA6_9FLAO|nr:DUF5689 domain-containing protein [Algibacter lectus]GAL64826.1 hypothetical protein JCM19300_3146 [Algibacter lectus]